MTSHPEGGERAASNLGLLAEHSVLGGGLQEVLGALAAGVWERDVA